MMSAQDTPQSAPAFETNQCTSFIGTNPENSLTWDRLVVDRLVHGGKQLEPELNNGPNHIRLCGLRRWKAGKDEAKGSGMYIEQFLHLRALVQTHLREPFPLQELVELKYANAAELFLKEWPDFDNYIDQVPDNDPAMHVDSLGLFAGAKLVQNQVLLDPYLQTSQDRADSFAESILETPLRKGRPGLDIRSIPPTSDAADEQIVNEALITFASALTRRWMVQKTSVAIYGADQTPTKGASTVPTHDWKTVGDWTMSRDRFHIRERIRDNDPVQARHITGLREKRGDNIVKHVDGHSYGRIMTSETDGSLYRIGPNTTEILAIVEAKKRLRSKNTLKIEWQEAAEILAWLNLRLRTESAERASRGGGPLTSRRGLLKPKLAVGNSEQKSRCLLVAQDREEIFLVVGEWDSLYEEYALEGRFSKASIEKLDRLKATRDPAGLDAGFLTLHVYGPFGGFMRGFYSRGESMKTLSLNLLALSLHLSQASCSPLSRRNSPPGSIQLPMPRGEPCCQSCTCNCCCKGRGASKPPSETSETSRGRRQGSREGSKAREPSTKSTASRPRQESQGREITPTRDPRTNTRRPGEIRAASNQQGPGTVQAQGHGSLPLRGRQAASDQQGSSSEAQRQAPRSNSRARDAAATGHHGQAPAASGALPRPPPLPPATGSSVVVPSQQRQPQQQGQQDPPGQPARRTQPHRDARRPPPSSDAQHQGGGSSTHSQPQIPRPQVSGQAAADPQRPPHDPADAGPSYPPQPGPSSFVTPSGASGPSIGGPSQPQRTPADTPVKKDKKKNPITSPIKDLFPGFGKKDRKGKSKRDKQGDDDDDKK